MALISITNLCVKVSGTPVLHNINLKIKQGEQWAIIGNSGSGKTTLAHAMMGKLFYSGNIDYNLPDHSPHTGNVLLIDQQHRFKNLFNTSDFYYQQRFNSSDSDNTITVAEALEEYSQDVASTNRQKWIELLHLSPLLQEPLIQLSNGENKRLQLAEALLADPSVLIMDNPFIGLDSEGRKTLQGIFDTITASGIHLVLITTPYELPESITHVALLENGAIKSMTKQEYYAIKQRKADNHHLSSGIEQLKKIPPPANPDFSAAIRMVNVSAKYGERKILDSINWNVMRGECWNISGPNGAGKSTLLSLITADNPQAYANEIYLFDKRRGRGESIWDIKRKIGYVSPELHVFFEQHSTCFEVIASGLFDTIGLFRHLSTEQEEIVTNWIELVQLQKEKRKLLSQLSLGQQRMVLLARALVKNPPLLILDEPCQGLDDEQADYIKNLIDRLCRQFHTTLLYVSHYERDIPSCVTNYLRLENGKQVEKQVH